MNDTLVPVAWRLAPAECEALKPELLPIQQCGTIAPMAEFELVFFFRSETPQIIKKSVSLEV